MTNRNFIKLEPQPEYKCKNCGYAQPRHQAGTFNCPFNADRFSHFRSDSKFESSGVLTIKSKREIENYKISQEISRKAKEEEDRQRAIVRALTFDEVIDRTVQLLDKYTGLGVIVEKRDDRYAEIHITNLGGRVRLGYTSVSKTHRGTYIVGGTQAGCFMTGHEDSINNILKGPFDKLEEEANKEKV